MEEDSISEREEHGYGGRDRGGNGRNEIGKVDGNGKGKGNGNGDGDGASNEKGDSDGEENNDGKGNSNEEADSDGDEEGHEEGHGDEDGGEDRDGDEDGDGNGNEAGGGYGIGNGDGDGDSDGDGNGNNGRARYMDGLGGANKGRDSESRQRVAWDETICRSKITLSQAEQAIFEDASPHLVATLLLGEEGFDMWLDQNPYALSDLMLRQWAKSERSTRGHAGRISSGMASGNLRPTKFAARKVYLC